MSEIATFYIPNKEEVLKCKHEWVTKEEGDITITYCEKCKITKKKLWYLIHISNNKTLSDY